MSDGSWKAVLEDYESAQEESWGKDLIWMEKLVSHLLSNRDLSMLYPITSHYNLIVFIGKKLVEKYDKPLLRIKLISENQKHLKDKFRYEFSIKIKHKENELFREFTETVFCSFEKSLEVFDEMFEKLKVSTK